MIYLTCTLLAATAEAGFIRSLFQSSAPGPDDFRPSYQPNPGPDYNPTRPPKPVDDELPPIAFKPDVKLPNLDGLSEDIKESPDRPCFNYGAMYCTKKGKVPEVRVFEPQHMGDGGKVERPAWIDLAESGQWDLSFPGVKHRRRMPHMVTFDGLKLRKPEYYKPTLELQEQLENLQDRQLGLSGLLQGRDTARETQLNLEMIRNLEKLNEGWSCQADCRVFIEKPEDRFSPVRPYKPYFPFKRPDVVDQPQCFPDFDENGDGKLDKTEQYNKDEYYDDRWNLDAINHERKWSNLTGWTYENNGQGTGLLDQDITGECKCCGLKKTVVFVIDTGIQSHEEFGSRLNIGESREFVSTSGADGVQGFGDTHGHGTHVAGTVGGCTVGVNSCTQLVGYRVFPTRSGSTSRSRIVRGINKVTSKRLDAEDSFANYDMTINLSVGGPTHQDYDDAVNAAYDAGITVVIAAGNGNTDACNSGPANVTKGITVGSTTKTNTLSGFTNYGKCVDIQAPGSDIYSAAKLLSTSSIYSMTESDRYTKMSGTSMAAPAVAGMASLVQAYRDKLNVTFENPGQVWKYIDCVARKNYIDGMGAGTVKGSPNPNSFLQRYLISNWKEWCGKLKPFPILVPDFETTLKPIPDLDPSKPIVDPSKPIVDPLKPIVTPSISRGRGDNLV